VSPQSLFRIRVLGCHTPMFSGRSKCYCTALDSCSGPERAAPGFMIFAINSQYKPCLTLIAKGKMQKHGLRFYRPISGT
jgi:hypothetical protein